MNTYMYSHDTQVVEVQRPSQGLDRCYRRGRNPNEGVIDDHCQLVSTPCALITTVGLRSRD